jgi:hypothetical protein
MLAVLGWQASAEEVSWVRQPGAAFRIASNASASLWMVGTDSKVYKWSGTDFIDQKISSTLIGVTTTDQLWLMNEIGLTEPGSGFFLDKVREIAIGPDNIAWAIGTDQRTGGYGVYKITPGLFGSKTPIGFGAVRVAVDKNRNAWVVNDAGEVHMYDIASQTWERKGTTKARSVHAGASSGAVWMLGATEISGGFPIYQWNFSREVWESFGTYAAVDMTEAAGVPWIVQKNGALYSKSSPTSTTTTETTLPTAGSITWPVPTPQAQPPFQLTQSGKALCSGTAYTDCGDTRADWVGKHALDTTCDNGFYDLIWGGTCWKCPEDDGRGGWLRSLDAVNTDTACWRSAKEETGRAILVRAPVPFAWDCPPGSFWDGKSTNGCCGSCWACPAGIPRRTANAVDSDAACASDIAGLHQTSTAIFLSYNGCSKPEPSTMGLTGHRTPGYPFLDIAAGGCFACPIVDETGNFLITDRNANALYDKTNNTGCTVKMKWQPPPFHEPGLAYMQGVKDLIWEQGLFNGARITGYLYDLAQAKGLGDETPEAKAWVIARWQEIVAKPYNNDSMRSFLFALIKGAIKKEAAQRTDAEKKLLGSFAGYIQNRRTYLAEQALAMYDSWKANDDLYRQQTGQSRSLGGLFYYGTVPYDFHGTLAGLMGLGGVGGATLGSLVAASEFGKRAVEVQLAQQIVKEAGDVAYGTARAREISLYWLSDSLNIFKSAQGLTAVLGASVIQVAGAILSSIAIDQFVKIETARTKLETAVAKAKLPVDLNALLNSGNGADTLYLYWSRAMDVTDAEDPQVIQLAALAQARAEHTGYAPPPKIDITAPAGTAHPDTLSSAVGEGVLHQYETLLSKNQKYEMEMRGDGNLVVVKTADRQPIWSSGTAGKGTAPYRLVMQSDGNLCIYGSNGFVWGSGLHGGVAPYNLVMQDDGNLVVYDKDGFRWGSFQASR